MCIFANDTDIPKHVRLSTRTLQYLIIPLLSIALLVVGVLHLDDCDSLPLLPKWHIVAGASGLVVPFLYLLFDDLNPALAKRCPGLSEALDNMVVLVLPIYILFEVGWLITGTVWLVKTKLEVDGEAVCDKTIYVFTAVVIVNFWIHILTPVFFMLGICLSRLCPFLGHCTYWNIVKGAVDMWTLGCRMAMCCIIALPLGLSMVGVGSHSLHNCINEHHSILPPPREDESFALETKRNGSRTTEYDLDLEMIHIPIWLIVSGGLVLVAPLIYYIYDVFCKAEHASKVGKNLSQCLVVTFLLGGLAWAVVGFLWIFGAHEIADDNCGSNSNTYMFSFSCLIILNALMDLWICFKICVILYWALLAGDE